MEEQGLQAVVFPCKRNHKDSGIHQFLQQIRLLLPASRKPGCNLVFIHRKAADLRILPQQFQRPWHLVQHGDAQRIGAVDRQHNVFQLSLLYHDASVDDTDAGAQIR